jgi:hypothetical protein
MRVTLHRCGVLLLYMLHVKSLLPFMTPLKQRPRFLNDADSIKVAVRLLSRSMYNNQCNFGEIDCRVRFQPLYYSRRESSVPEVDNQAIQPLPSPVRHTMSQEILAGMVVALVTLPTSTAYATVADLSPLAG